MKMTIARPPSGQLPEVKGPEMNDRDFVNDLLAYEKYLTSGYNTGLFETQNPQLRRTVQDILNDVHKSQSELFELMFQRGWYKMDAAEAEQIGKTHQQFSNYRSQFPDFS